MARMSARALVAPAGGAQLTSGCHAPSMTGIVRRGTWSWLIAGTKVTHREATYTSVVKTTAMRSAPRVAAPLFAALLICAVSLACKQGNDSTSPTPLAAVGTLAGTPTADQQTDTELAVSPDATPATGLQASSPALLPDPALTPGDVLPAGVNQICVTGYSTSVRNVSTATKNTVYAEYHIVSHATGQYEVDHLIPLELGGSNSMRNLWPEPAEPRPGFHEKDVLENRLHALVCAGSVDLMTAQRAIAANWWTAYIPYERGGTIPTAAPPTAPPAGGALPFAPSASVAFTSVVGARPGG